VTRRRHRCPDRAGSGDGIPHRAVERWASAAAPALPGGHPELSGNPR